MVCYSLGGFGGGGGEGEEKKREKKKPRITPGSVYMQAIISERRQSWHVYSLACVCICDRTDSACSPHTSFVDLIKVGGKAEHSNGPIEFFFPPRPDAPCATARHMFSSCSPEHGCYWFDLHHSVQYFLTYALLIYSIYSFFFRHRSTSRCYRFAFFKLYSVAKVAVLRSNDISLYYKSLLCLLLRWQ